MNQKELFAPILQNDEEIIKTFKPNKKRFVVISSIFGSFGFLIIAGLCSILMVLGFTGKVLDEEIGKLNELVTLEKFCTKFTA